MKGEIWSHAAHTLRDLLRSNEKTGDATRRRGGGWRDKYYRHCFSFDNPPLIKGALGGDADKVAPCEWNDYSVKYGSVEEMDRVKSFNSSLGGWETTAGHLGYDLWYTWELIIRLFFNGRKTPFPESKQQRKRLRLWLGFLHRCSSHFIPTLDICGNFAVFSALKWRESLVWVGLWEQKWPRFARVESLDFHLELFQQQEESSEFTPAASWRRTRSRASAGAWTGAEPRFPLSVSVSIDSAAERADREDTLAVSYRTIKGKISRENNEDLLTFWEQPNLPKDIKVEVIRAYFKKI